MEVNWIKSENAGYSKGSLLLDVPNTSRFWSVYFSGGKWIAALIENRIAIQCEKFKTRKDAKLYCEGMIVS
jgi:hypothetical protein